MQTEDVLIVLFCEVDDCATLGAPGQEWILESLRRFIPFIKGYHIRPHGAGREPLERCDP
jgi:hypothetical protein